MGKRASQQPEGRLSPAVATAAAAAAASAVASLLAFALWSLDPSAQGVSLPAALALLASPMLVGLAVLAAARWAIRAGLSPAVESIERLAAQDFSTEPAPACGEETAALARALERCHAALEGRQRAVKVHAAVARLAGAAVSRLAEGDLSARITVELPQPYDRLRDDFNAAMERLESMRAASGGPGGRLREHAREIGEAAAQLSRRAGKLAERIDADMIAAEGAGEDADATLRRVLHTMAGVRVAAQRNAEAAERFADLGLLVAQEAQGLADLAGGLAGPHEEEQADAPCGEVRAEMRRLPAATLPASIGSAALRLEG